MRLENNDIYFMSKSKEESIWKDCFFVFDTSALLQFYYLTPNTQSEIFNNVFEKARTRLWIPFQVEYEYLKNRKKTLLKPIEEKYNKIEKENLSQFKNSIQKMSNQIRELKQLLSKEESHPHINISIVDEFQKKFDSIEVEYQTFESEVFAEFKIREQEIRSFLSNDTVLNNFLKYLGVGEEFDFKKIMEIVDEGEKRFNSKIPPGYEDGLGSKKKDGFQRYGDLIIWKQIIQFAKEQKKPIIFITNDTKEDWCYSIKRSNDFRIERPREELIKEIKDESNVGFWMYTLAQFLFVSKDLLNANITDEAIEDAKVHRRRNVLIADDDRILRSILISKLEHLPVDFTEAADGEEAYEILTKQSVDLCILDGLMPRLDGFEMLERLVQEGTMPEGLGMKRKWLSWMGWKWGCSEFCLRRKLVSLSNLYWNCT